MKMFHVLRRRLALLAAVPLMTALLSGCGGPGPQFTILSGSENDILEPLVQEFCKSRNATCTMRYQGSLDIALALKAGDPGADAVWPAASIWIDMFDTTRRVKMVKSIVQMPVILGVRLSKAQELGWIGAKVTAKDILAAVEGGKLKFLMTSATQSNSGAAAYLAMLAAGIGKPDLIEAGDLDKPEVLAMARGLLKGVERSAGSSGWLADLYRDGERSGAHYQAIWNYEAVIKETNDKLIADNHEPLYAIYPADGVAIADSPLGFVDRGRGKDVEGFFTDLQAFLLNGDAQARIAKTGRRVEIGPCGRPEDESRSIAAGDRDPSAGARGHSEGAPDLSGSAAPAVADRALPRCLRQHARRRRNAAARRDAFPAHAGADPRGAGPMDEVGRNPGPAVQRSHSLVGARQRRRE